MNYDLWHRSQKTIAQGALTNSKHPEMLIFGAYPTHIAHGAGSHLYDKDGRKYLDYICGLGTNLFGYGNDKISKELLKAIYGGFSHSLPTHHEIEAGEALKTIFNFVDKWKFLKSGSDACSAAIKIARNATNRDLILSQGYHGWHDDFVSLTSPGSGVPRRDFVKSLVHLEDITHEVAAVIIEPVITDFSKDRIEWLRKVEKRCNRVGALLIFDEVITGFRFSKFGVCNFFGITPDLLVIGKAIANGMPLAAVGGKAGIMDDAKYFISSTYAGEVLSLISCKKVCELLTKDSEYSIDRLWKNGQELIDAFNKQPGDIKILGYPTRGVFSGSENSTAIFFGEMARSDVLFCKSFFYNFGHIPFNLDLLGMALEVKERILDGSLTLKYPLPKSPFSQGVRDGSKRNNV